MLRLADVRLVPPSPIGPGKRLAQSIIAIEVFTFLRPLLGGLESDLIFGGSRRVDGVGQGLPGDLDVVHRPLPAEVLHPVEFFPEREGQS